MASSTAFMITFDTSGLQAETFPTKKDFVPKTFSNKQQSMLQNNALCPDLNRLRFTAISSLLTRLQAIWRINPPISLAPM